MTQIRICGAGGQGVVLAGILLGHAGMLDGRHSCQSSSYGAEARGSACAAEVVLADGWIDFPHVLEADILVALSQPGYETFRRAVRPGGRIFHDADLVRPAAAPGPPHCPVPATAIALERLGRRVTANLVMLGAVAAATGVVGRRALEEALRANLPPAALALNQEALAAGFACGEALRL